jgi:O-antigen/teichoic acid export membrane protein
MIEKKKVVIASLWILAIFGLSQLLRLGSNLVVTRFLGPEMFGIMAIVFIVMHGVSMFSDLGIWAFIVRHKDGSDKNMLNTVWTVQVIRGWLMFMIVVAIALLLMAISHLSLFPLGEVYGSDDLPWVLMAVGVTAVITGYKTLAPALLSRELKRGRLEIIELISQACGITVMVALAWKYQSIWSLASAAVVSSAINLLLIYCFFDVRHQFAWDKKVTSELFTFGKWIFLASILTFLGQQGDRLIFASYISVAQLGVYSIAFMLTEAVTNILNQMIEKIWYPVLSKIANEHPHKLKEIYYKLRLKQDFFIFLAIGILIRISPDVIEYLYDERFHGAGWMMQILSFSLIGLALSKVGLECLSVLGFTKVRMTVMLIRSLSVFIGLPLLFYYYGFYGAIWGVVLSSFISIPVQFFEMRKQNVFSFVKEIRMLPMVFIGYLSSQLIFYDDKYDTFVFTWIIPYFEMCKQYIFNYISI